MSLADLFQTRTAITETSTFSDPADWLLEHFDAQSTHTGRMLSKRGSEALPVLWGCKQVLEQDIAKLPLDAFQRTSDGGRRKATETPQHQLLRIRPNPEQTPSQFKGMLMFHLLSYGAAYGEIEREDPDDIRSPPVNLWPLLSDRTKPKRFEGVKILETWVTEKDGSKVPKILLPGEYFHIPGRGFDGLTSYSPLEFAKQSIALGLAEEEWLARFYDGDAQAAAWVSVPDVPIGRGGAAKRKIIRDGIREQTGGLNRAHRLGILWAGAELQESKVTPREQQLVEGMGFNGYQICRFFRVMPHKVQLMEHATFTNIEHQGLEHVTDSLMPWTRAIQEALDWELWSEHQRGEYFFDWNFRDLLRGDARAEAEAIKIGVVGGWISRAEARQLTNRNPAPAEHGLDEFLVGVNQMPSRVLTQMVAQAGSEDGARALYRRMFGLPEEQRPRPVVLTRDAPRNEKVVESRSARSAAARYRLRIAHEPIFLRSAQRYISAEVRASQRILERSGEDLADFNRRMRHFYEGFSETIARELRPTLVAFGAVIADSITEEIGAPVAGGAYDVLVASVVKAEVDRHIRKSQGVIAGVISDSESPTTAVEALTARFDDWLELRPRKAARSVSVRTGGWLAQEAYAAGGVRQKMWVTFGSNCPLCSELDGKIVGVRGAFLSAGETLDPAVEGTTPLTAETNIRHAPLHSECDCMITSA